MCTERKGCWLQDKTKNNDTATALLVEPFCGGSHHQLMEMLIVNMPQCKHYCLPAKKWHWRMRTSALYFAEVIPHSETFKTLFASSVLNMAELVALRPDLAKLKKVLYFHENQLVYPVRKQQDRDFQYGYNQILSCLVADIIVFNSKFNMESFLNNINSFLKLIPDHQPKGIKEVIAPKCRVVYFPLLKNISCEIPQHQKTSSSSSSLHIVWPHRWEHDKNPDLFFNTLFHLMEEKLDFRVSVIGQSFSEIPEIFSKARERLGDRVVNWGFMKSRMAYLEVLKTADVAVSTADHEFFGVAMLEAVQCGCYPLCPKELVYPEIFPAESLYGTAGQLAKKLRYFCKNPGFVRAHKLEVDLSRFSWDILKESYHELIT